LTVQFSDRPSEAVLDCLRSEFTFNGKLWHSEVDDEAYRAIRRVLTVLDAEDYDELA